MGLADRRLSVSLDSTRSFVEGEQQRTELFDRLAGSCPGGVMERLGKRAEPTRLKLTMV